MPRTPNVNNLRAGDSIQSPSGTHYDVYYLGVNKVYVERDIHVRDTSGWLQPFGSRYVSLDIAGLRQGDRLKREGHTGEFVVKNAIYAEGLVIVTEYLELSDLAGWTIVRPG